MRFARERSARSGAMPPFGSWRFAEVALDMGSGEHRNQPEDRPQVALPFRQRRAAAQVPARSATLASVTWPRLFHLREIDMKIPSSMMCALATFLITICAAAQTSTSPATGATSAPAGSSAANPGTNAERAKKGLHVKQGQSRKQTFDKMDIDHDGFISRDEAQADPILVILFVDTDADNDGRLSAAEFVLVPITQEDGAAVQ
jgi:hypothetical protein